MTKLGKDELLQINLLKYIYQQIFLRLRK